MQNITFSADERLIDAAQERARSRNTTMDEEFRLWLDDYVGRTAQAKRAMEVIERIRFYADTGGRKFTRDEMNFRPMKVLEALDQRLAAVEAAEPESSSVEAE